MTANIIRKRYTPPYTPHIETCRTTGAAFLDELATDGIGDSYTEGNRSAHWWVGCLSSQLEYFLAATEPAPRKTDEEREQAEAQARLMAAEMTPGRRGRWGGAK